MSEQLLTMILIGVAIVLLLVLIFVAIEIIRTVRKVRSSLDELMPSVNEAVTRVNTAIATLEPSLKRVDPLLERASLTVDAVNLEIMRVDQILADLSDVTDVASGAVKKVSGITEAPLNLLTSATDKIRNVFSDKRSEKRHAKALNEAEKKTVETSVPAPGSVSTKESPAQGLHPQVAQAVQAQAHVQARVARADLQPSKDHTSQLQAQPMAGLVSEPGRHMVEPMQYQPDPLQKTVPAPVSVVDPKPVPAAEYSQPTPASATHTSPAAIPSAHTDIKPPSSSASSPPPSIPKLAL